MDTSVGNVGFSVLPEDASTCSPGKPESNHRPSDWWATALPPELLFLDAKSKSWCHWGVSTHKQATSSSSRLSGREARLQHVDPSLTSVWYSFVSTSLLHFPFIRRVDSWCQQPPSVLIGDAKGSWRNRGMCSQSGLDYIRETNTTKCTQKAIKF